MQGRNEIKGKRGRKVRQAWLEGRGKLGEGRKEKKDGENKIQKERKERKDIIKEMKKIKEK